MKIAIDVSQVVYKTGVSRYTKELVRHLLKIDKKNEYLLFAGVWRQKKEVLDFFDSLAKEKLKFSQKVVFLPPKFAEIVFNGLGCWVDNFIGKVDVFHASNWTTPKTSAKLVTTVHDLAPILYPKSFPKKIIDNFAKNLFLIKKNADAVLVDSLSTRQDLLKQTGILADKIHLVYLSAGDKFKPVKDKSKIALVKKKHGIKSNYLLSVGTQEPRKNIKKLIKAFIDNQRLNKKLTERNGDGYSCQLVLVGKFGWGDKSLKSSSVLAIGKNKNLKILELGFVADKDLPALYSGAKVFVYPSLYEGFGLPVLEAMACASPVITSNRSATAEIADGAGLLVNPQKTETINRAINKVLFDQSIRDSLIKKGLARARQFSWEKTAKETLKVYENI